MKLRLFVSQLADAVSYTAKALPARAPVPVMMGMLLTTGQDGLRLSAADGEVHTCATVAAEIADDGTALVPGRLLNDICSRLPKSAEVDLELVDKGARLVVGCGTARFTLPVLPVDEYPTMPALPDAIATVQADVLAEAVAQVAVAAATDTALPALTGLKLRLDGELLHLYATDRYRMAHKELTVRPTGTLPTAKRGKAKKKDDDPAVVLVPARNLAEAAKALEGEHTLTLHWSEGLFGLSIPGGRTYMTRLLDGYEFPKMDGFFDGDWPMTITVPVAEAVLAIQRVALVAARNTPIRLEADGEQLRVEAGSGDDAQASDRIPAHTTGEGGVGLAFNPGFLVDALKALGTSEAEIHLRHPHKPALLAGRVGEDTDATYRHLLMPVRLSG